MYADKKRYWQPARAAEKVKLVTMFSMRKKKKRGFSDEKKRREFGKICRRNAEHFLRVWLFYNEKILASLKVLSPDKYVVLNYDTLNEKDKEVADFMVNNWKFSLQYFSFSKIFKKDLFSETLNVEPYIKNKALIADAQRLKANLMNFVPA